MPGNVALSFARTRHTDSDYERARRQQQLIVAAVKKVLKRGPKALPSSSRGSTASFKTDIDLKDAPALLALAERAQDRHLQEHRPWAPASTAGPGDVQYSTKLKIDVVRDFFRKQFGPVKR